MPSTICPPDKCPPPFAIRTNALCQLPSGQMPSTNCPPPFALRTNALHHMPSAICPLNKCPLPIALWTNALRTNALHQLPSRQLPSANSSLFGGHLDGEHLAEGFWTKDGEHLSRGHLSRGLFLESYCKRAFGRGLFAWRASGTKSGFCLGTYIKYKCYMYFDDKEMLDYINF